MGGVSVLNASTQFRAVAKKLERRPYTRQRHGSAAMTVEDPVRNVEVSGLIARQTCGTSRPLHFEATPDLGV